MADKPKMIFVMRHAEKPADNNDPNLSAPGQQRAIKLASFIPNDVAKPDFIIATAVSHKSARPYETVKPLSDATGIVIDDKIADDDYPKVAEDLLTKDKFADKVVVVCWHHGKIPKLMAALGAKKGDYPDPWDCTVFNLILKVTFSGDEVNVEPVTEPF